MDDTQKLVKDSIEKELKNTFCVDAIVEYTSDVTLRIHEIEQQCGEKFKPVYEANIVAGAFLPAVKDNPYYILIKDNVEEMKYIMTAYHEYKHLIDYLLFFKTVFNNDSLQLEKSSLYGAFNVYSEYSATMFGVKEYIEKVTLGDLSQEELAETILQRAKTTYWNLKGIDNRYQLLVHSVQYLGGIVACGQFIDKIDIQGYIREMELSSELCPVFNHIFMYEDKYQWYEKLSRIMRKFVDGGIEN